MFASAEIQHVETFMFSGKHQVTFKSLSPDAKADIAFEGFKIYMFCDGYVDTFISAFNFAL